MVFYFTATGNSLYVAKHLDNEQISIPQEMRKEHRIYQASRIGIVCPLFEFEVPKLVKDFIRESIFETEYFYLVITYGMHHGGVAQRTQAWLNAIGKKADYISTIIMHDNAIIFCRVDQTNWPNVQLSALLGDGGVRRLRHLFPRMPPGMYPFGGWHAGI